MSTTDPLPLSHQSLCGIWCSPEGTVLLSWATEDGQRVETVSSVAPQIWLSGPLNGLPGTWQELEGEGPLNWIYQATDLLDANNLLTQARDEKQEVLAIRPWEHHWLTENQQRLFQGLSFSQLRRCQVDIETRGTVGFPNPALAEDRILAIGVRQGKHERLLELEENSDQAEKELLIRFHTYLRDLDPDIIEGHNIFRFDLHYLRERSKRLRVPCLWGRFGQKATFRKTRIRIAERWIDYPRCDIPGRTVFDTWLMIQIWDLGERNLSAYGLKEVSRELGITKPENERTYLPGDQIGQCFDTDRETFRLYLRDDLRETAELADFLLPTYVSQVNILPMTLQEACLRGTAAKVDLLILERYLESRFALPEKSQVAPFEGGFSNSFAHGVFRKVLHYDVASLYPSLLLWIGRNPVNDPLHTFLPLLKELRELRLRYKQLAVDAEDPEEKREYQARQNSYKILINSFYGYLGFSEARFGDGELASEVTASGRELLQNLIAEFERQGTPVLEADTDGLYVHAPDFFDQPEALLERVQHVLPPRIDLELGGKYDAMLCYKTKNYALLSSEKVIIRGSALRSRGMEPFLKDLTQTLIHWLLDPASPDPRMIIQQLREALTHRTLPVEQLAKSEFLGSAPDTYQKQADAGLKPRRASLEAALQKSPLPAMGDLVRFFIVQGDGTRQPDWQRAAPLESFDPVEKPYDSGYYLKRLDTWEKRYAEFLSDYRQEDLL